MFYQMTRQQGPAYGYAPDGRLRDNAHAIRDTQGNEFFFSYQTLVAFRPIKGAFAGVVLVRKNEWSTTTGKHLNWIDGGDSVARFQRVPGDEFERLYKLHISEA